MSGSRQRKLCHSFTAGRVIRLVIECTAPVQHVAEQIWAQCASLLAAEAIEHRRHGPHSRH